MIIGQLANTLTISRLAAAPLFFVCYPDYQIALFVYACISEFLDGFLARMLKSETSFGKIMDPIADKTFILTVVVTLMVHNKLALYELILVGFRDLTVIAGAIVVLAGGHLQQFKKMDPGWWGKLTTGWQLAFLFTVLVLDAVHPWFLASTALLSLTAAVMYVRFFFAAGIHLAPNEQLNVEADQCRKNEMLALVAMVIGATLLIALMDWRHGRLQAQFESLASRKTTPVCEHTLPPDGEDAPDGRNRSREGNRP